jgi:hypothetical protein
MTRYGVEVGGKIATGWFDSRQFAQYEAATLRHQGHKLVRVVMRKGNTAGGHQSMRRMTKTARREKTRKVSAKRRVAVALKNFLTKANPGRKYAGCKMQRNAGGSITIIPVKLPKGRK